MSKPLLLYNFYILLYSFLINFTLLNCSIVPKDFDKRISNKYKSDLEFDFDKNHDSELLIPVIEY